MFVLVKEINVNENIMSNKYERKKNEIYLNTESINYIRKDTHDSGCQSTDAVAAYKGLHLVELSHTSFFVDEVDYQKLCRALGINA